MEKSSSEIKEDNKKSVIMHTSLEKVFLMQLLKELETRLFIYRVVPFRDKIFSNEEIGWIQIKTLLDSCYVKEKKSYLFGEK